MKPLVIYHANCADGFGASFAAWLALGDEAEYLPMQYGKVPEVQDLRDLVDEREVYVLDFSLPKAGMDELFRSAKRVVWLDHHKTAFEMWCGKYEKGMEYTDYTLGDHDIFLDDTRSGAMIAWQTFHPDEEVPLLFKHIDDYDRWQFKLEGTKAFNKALWSYAPWSFVQWNSRFLGEGLYHDILSEGTAILRAHDQNVTSVVNAAGRACTILTPWMPGITTYAMPGRAANCPPHLTSDVGHQLANQSGTFGLCWYLDREGKCCCSLRSNGDYDVSAIAKAFGGGGHKNAAGFEIDIQTLFGWLQ